MLFLANPRKWTVIVFCATEGFDTYEIETERPYNGLAEAAPPNSVIL
jgi:hypothetical protein